MKGTVTVLAPGSAPAPGPIEPAQSVRVRLTSRRGPHGRLALVHVQAPHPTARVVLELRSALRSPWRIVDRAHLNALGEATLSVSASVRGRLRVVVEGTGGLPPLISKTLSPSA
jgi:hypothetical protein